MYKTVECNAALTYGWYKCDTVNSNTVNSKYTLKLKFFFISGNKLIKH